MTDVAELPGWVALTVSFLLLVGAGLALIGSFGLVRFRNFYDRIHAPTLGTTLGIGSVLVGSMLFFTVMEGRAVLHELLIAVFMVLTTPVTLMLLARAALYRDRREGRLDVPRASPGRGPEGD